MTLKTMIDTIILKFPLGKFYIEQIDKFGTTKPEVLNGKDFYKKFYNNPDDSSLLEKGYQPRLTLYRRGRVIELKVEFSAPKMLFSNNLNELEENDLNLLVSNLKRQIEARGVRIGIDDILNAEVSAFHASKNIRLNKGYTSIAVIKELSKINLTQKLDMDHKDFRNGGHSLQYYAKSHALVLYDKVRDLKKPTKRAVDKENKINQLSLFDYLANKSLPEIIRIEARLSQKQKMNSVLKKLGLLEHPRLKDIFKKDVCQKIVSHYWEEMILDGNTFLFQPLSNPQRIIQRIIKKDKKIKPKEVIYLAGLYIIVKDLGIRELRILLSQLSSQRSWYRIADDFKKLKLARYQYEWVKEIKDAIKKFEPLRINGP